MTPFVVPFARAFDAAEQTSVYGARYQALALVCGAQMSKTDLMLDIAGWTLDQRPAPIMFVGPSKDWLHNEVEPRLMQMLTTTRGLAERMSVGKKTSKYRKYVGGVPLQLAWAGSATSLRGMAAKFVLVDELDAMAKNLQNEGDPFALSEARGFSYRDRIRAAISTPLVGSVDTEIDEASGLELWKKMDAEDVSSAIWRVWQNGTRHHFTWPCPHCGEHFVPRFKQLRWKTWPEIESATSARDTAYVECPHCEGEIREEHKADCNARGRYVAPGQTVTADGEVIGAPPEATTLSFWVSGLCSPFVTIGERAASYAAAKLSGQQTELQSVINTGFGECYAPGGGDVAEWMEVAALKRDYHRLELPAGARLLTLTADVQSYGIYYTIRAWGVGGSSWLVDFDMIDGATVLEEVWDKLAVIIARPIGGMMISRALVDSGYRPGKANMPVHMVYKFCRRFYGRVYPSKGRDKLDKPVKISKQEVKKTGQVHRYGLDLVWLDTDVTKSWVHERLRWSPDAPGAWLLPADTSDDYCKQIVSEARLKKPSGSPEWVPRSRQNHYLDCEAMQAGLALWMRVDLIQQQEPEPPAKAPATTIRLPRGPGKATTPGGAAVVTKPAGAKPATSEAADRLARIRAAAQRMRTQ